MIMDWKSEFYNIYGDRLACSVGSPDAKVQKTIDKTEDIAVYCHNKLKIAVIWDVNHHRKNEGEARNLSYSKEWSKIKLQADGLECDYKKFKTKSGYEFEKILIVSFETLQKIRYNLYDYLKFDKGDNNFPNAIIRAIHNKNYEWTNENNRRRIAVTTWKRNYRFRQTVLNNYDCKCAICNCAEEKLLEAAHIRAVKDDGMDTLENGICLCRNHHKMFDEKLIELDFDNHIIHIIKPSIKDYINKTLTFNLGNHELKA